MTTWIGQENGSWTLSGTALREYQSSPGTTRGFCGRCGTPMFYRSERFPNETHFYASLLADPGAISPTAHYHYDEKLAWLHLDDDLIRK